MQRCILVQLCVLGVGLDAAIVERPEGMFRLRFVYDRCAYTVRVQHLR